MRSPSNGVRAAQFNRFPMSASGRKPPLPIPLSSHSHCFKHWNLHHFRINIQHYDEGMFTCYFKCCIQPWDEAHGLKEK